MAIDLDHKSAASATDLPPAGPGKASRAAIVTIVVLPILASVVQALRTSWFPIGDRALLYIRTKDVLTDHHPLLGSWTSASKALGVDVNNPGPTYDFLIAPFAQFLSPGPAAALGVGAVNIVAIIGISAASRHIGGWAMQRWMLLAAAALAWAMGSELLIDIWQPHALLLPFLLFLILITGCAAGLGRLVPITVGVGTLLIQTHLGYTYILALLLGIAIGIVWWQNRPVDWRAVPSALRSRTAVTTFVVIVVLWAHPLYEQLFGEGRGNLTRLLSNSRGGSLTVGWANSTEIAGAIMVQPWWWTRPGFSDPIASEQSFSQDGTSIHLGGLPGFAISFIGLAVITVAFALLTRAVHRRGLRRHTAAGALATASVPAVVLSLSRLTIGPIGLATHHVRWVWVMAVFLTFVAAWIASDLWAADRAEARTKWLTPAAVGMTALLSMLNIGYVGRQEGLVSDVAAMPTMRRVFPEIEMLAGHDPVLYDTSSLRVFESYSGAMMMRMQQLGIEFRVPDEVTVRQLGNNRRADGTETTVVFQLEGVEALNYTGPACTIALASALSESDEDIARANSELFAQQLVEGRIAVDASRLAADDRIDQLAVAQEGDLDAAWLLAIDGTLWRWATEGIATSQNPDLAVELTQIFDWMLTSYGLFAEGPWPCPDADQDTGS
jgi:hypothetical protein